MKPSVCRSLLYVSFGLLCAGCSPSLPEVAAANPDSTNQKPIVTITLVPPYDRGGPHKLDDIAGTVVGACDKCRIVLFALGDLWYVQPWTARKYTPIAKDGRWESETHLGTKYAALLVRLSYHAPDTTLNLPDVGGDVLASVVVRGRR